MAVSIVIPGSRRRRRCDVANAADHGFTLVEMLVVLVIVALSATALASFIAPRRSGVELRAATASVEARLREARTAAIGRQMEILAVFDAAHHRLSANDGRPGLALPESVGFELTAASTEQRSIDVGGIRFYPNGSSSGAVVRLFAERQTNEIRVNWLTGRVSSDVGAVDAARTR